MGLFKTEEEKQNELNEKIKKEEKLILKHKKFYGKIGQIHQGLSVMGLWGVLDNGKTKFKASSIEIHDDRLLIERNKNIINLADIKEIFQEVNYEAIIILNNGDGIPIQGMSIGKTGQIQIKAFINILNKLIEDYNTNNNNINPPKVNNVQSDDKFDKLIKLGEMHNQGLLSDQEFASLKQELLAEDTTPKIDDEPSDTTCENCGAEVSPNDAFCSECGTKIN